MSLKPSVTIRVMQSADLDLLHTICREAYSRNFHHHWTGDGLVWYLEKVFGRDLGKTVCWLAVLDANTPAIAFYEKHGFRFHSTTRVPYPLFREELKGMWRMTAEIGGPRSEADIKKLPGNL